MPTQQELRKMLLHNIREIQKIIPDFRMTEEQINEMLSPERISLQNRVKEYLEHRGSEDAQTEELKKYSPGEQVPVSFARNFYFVMKMDGSPESEAFNKTMFEGLNRDDEVGDIKRTNYYLYCLNEVKNLDRHILKPDCTEAEKIDYCIRNYDAINLGMETQRFLDKTEEIKLKKEALEKIRIGHDIGEGFVGYLKYVSTGIFLTFPSKFLTPGQQMLIAQNAGQINVQGGQEPFVTEFVGNLAEVTMREIPRIAEADPEAALPEDLTMEDLEYRIPQEGRYLGGYSARVAAAKRNLQEIIDMTGREGMESLAPIHKAADQAMQTLNQVHEIPTTEERAAIVSQMKVLDDEMVKVFSNSAKYPEGVTENFKQLMGPITMLGDAGKLEDLVWYEEQDRKAALMDRSESFRRIDEQLKKMNDAISLLDSTGEGLTQQDIHDLRVQTAEILRLSEDYLERNPVEDRDVNGEIIRNIREKMYRQQRNLGRAAAGVKASEAVSGYTREVDITGHPFHADGSRIGTRIPLKISGNDGAPVNGYFVERTTLDPETMRGRIRRKLLESHPDQEARIDDLIAFHMQIPGNKAREEHLDRLKQDHPGAEADIESLDNQARELCVQFTSAKFKYQTILGSAEKADVETRSIAMSDVADLLGARELLARSTPMTIYNDGKAMEGCFVEAAEGDNPGHVAEGKAPHFLQAGPDFLDNSPALKQIADLQVLDYICGNIGRDAGNMICQFSEDGKKVQKITGIDNDYSFPERENREPVRSKMVQLEEMRIVSESMAEKLSCITPDMLRCTLSGSHLTEQEISRAVERLEMMQRLIQDPDRPFEIVPDQDISGYQLEELASDRNLFGQIRQKYLQDVHELDDERKKGIPDNIRPEEAEQDTVDLFRRADKTAVIQDAGPVAQSVELLQGARRHVFLGSSEYDAVQTAMEEVQRALTILSDPDRTADEKTLKNLRKAYNIAEKKCVAYLNRKKRQNKLNADGKTGRRIEAVRKAMRFCRNRQASITLQLGDDPSIDENMRREMEQVTMEELRQNPDLAGEVLSQAVELADQNQKNAELQRKAVRQIGQVVRFMKKEGLKPQQLGISEEVQRRAAEVVRRSKALDAVEKKIDAKAPVML